MPGRITKDKDKAEEKDFKEKISIMEQFQEYQRTWSIKPG